MTILPAVMMVYEIGDPIVIINDPPSPLVMECDNSPTSGHIGIERLTDRSSRSSLAISVMRQTRILNQNQQHSGLIFSFPN